MHANVEGPIRQRAPSPGVKVQCIKRAEGREERRQNREKGKRRQERKEAGERMEREWREEI